MPGGLQMFVAEACSGMRQLTGFLALTAAVAYLTTRPAWYRVVIVISAVPIAMTANIARVMLTGYIMHFVNPQFASGTYHTVEGLLMMGFGLLLLQCECWVLDQICQTRSPRRRAQPGSRRRTAARRLGGRVLTDAAAALGRGSIEPRSSRGVDDVTNSSVLFSAVAILSTGLAAQAGLERLNQTERPALRMPLASIPMELGDWVGRERAGRSRHHRAGPDDRVPQPGLREPQAARA